jgi:NAD(P) transhydrogenase subunit beta
MNATPLLLLLAAESPAAGARGGTDVRNVVAAGTYLVAAALFVLALKWLSAPATARRGNLAGQIGMAAAIVGALLNHHVVRYEWIVIGFAVGALVGAPMAIWMPMTSVPQRTALSHAFGALAAALCSG